MKCKREAIWFIMSVVSRIMLYLKEMYAEL